MLNDDSNENSNKINTSNHQKKTNLHVQHTFLYISLPLFCMTTKLCRFAQLKHETS